MSLSKATRKKHIASLSSEDDFGQLNVPAGIELRRPRIGESSTECNANHWIQLFGTKPVLTISSPPISVTGRRFQTNDVSTTFLKAGSKQKTFAQTWLQDAGTYPMIVIMSGAMLLVLGASFSALTYCPDVQLSPQKRNSVVRFWGK